MSARLAVAVALLAALVQPASAAPANDDFDDATELRMVDTAVADLTGATAAADEPAGCSFLSTRVTVWYTVTALADVRLVINTLREGFASHIVDLYVGDSRPTLRHIGCSNSSLIVASSGNLVRLAAGETAYLRVSGEEGARFPLSVSPAVAGDIEGRVTDPEGRPVPGLCIWATSGVQLHRAGSDADGRYVVTVPPGSYDLVFWDCGRQEFVQEWYDDKWDFGQADRIEVTAGQTRAGIDAVLSRLVRISGTVRGPSGELLDRICVNGWRDGGRLGDHDVLTWKGEYTLVAPPGRYRMQFTDCHNEVKRYQGEWYDDSPSLSGARWLTLGDGETLAGVDAVLNLL